MFESDDFDQVLSQFDFPEIAPATKPQEITNVKPGPTENISLQLETEEPKQINREIVLSPKNVIIEKPILENEENSNINNNTSKSDCFVSPKYTKRKIINSYFDHKNKRKFPGPAGLLTGVFEEPKDESICQIELFSQDIDCTEYNLRRDLFESSIWKRLLEDVQVCRLQVDSIKSIKLQAVAGNLRKQKAQNVTAFVEAIDRSATDPLVILRDSTGSIKCTLHRDAWTAFSPYIASEYCALVLQKPTVLTTGGAFKKHYLNITLSNILAMYSSAVLSSDMSITLPEGYSIVYQDEFTVIKTHKCSDTPEIVPREANNTEDLLNGLDSSFFVDDIF